MSTNPFVYYPQRGIELPAGCKDLIDKLRLQHRPGSAPERTYSAGFEDIQRHLSCLLESKADERRLVISFSAPAGAMVVESGPFLLGYRPSGLSVLVYVDSTEPLLEPAVRTVFEEAGYSAFAAFGVGGGVEPMRMLRYPLPDAATEAAGLICDVLRRGFSLSDQAQLGLDYREQGGR